MMLMANGGWMAENSFSETNDRNTRTDYNSNTNLVVRMTSSIWLPVDIGSSY